MTTLKDKTLFATGGSRGTCLAVNRLGGDELMMHSRKPDIMADAACVIVNKPSRAFTGNFCSDDSVIEVEGVTDLSHYAVNPGPLTPDFCVDPKAG
ncbi:MAG: hypothetical protein OEM60_04775 [Gammaproteobacteria bacterium]|nr:hypothetical protein [Gammaproteobacteria bacterium]MDH3430845.1 hypothetical protein [Gammaproteobacteria bacterium]MDH3433145.1 hypothetical protein [Gammaproteobacteria bacterium]